jgi:hypothetical protein
MASGENPARLTMPEMQLSVVDVVAGQILLISLSSEPVWIEPSEARFLIPEPSIIARISSIPNMLHTVIE